MQSDMVPLSFLPSLHAKAESSGMHKTKSAILLGSEIRSSAPSLHPASKLVHGSNLLTLHSPISTLAFLAFWLSKKVLIRNPALCRFIRGSGLHPNDIRGGSQEVGEGIGSEEGHDGEGIPSESATNPLWPNGVSEHVVQTLVSLCLKDSDLNIQGIPDSLERQLYHSTIRLTLNGVYQSLGSWHGELFLGHVIYASRIQGEASMSELRDTLDKVEAEGHVEDYVLEMVADRMLANPDVNLRFLPDGIERALYVNCLKIVFRVLALVSATMTLTVCGHDVSLDLSPSTRYAIQKAALKQSNKLISSLDLMQVREFVRQSHGIQAEASTEDQWFWQRWWSQWNFSTHNELMVQMHSSLYSLLLNILDDLLDHTEIRILSDTIQYDFVPGNRTSTKGSLSTNMARLPDAAAKSVAEASRPPRPYSSLSFIKELMILFLGVGAGLSLQKLVPLPDGYPVIKPQSLPEGVKDLLSRLISRDSFEDQ